MSFFSLYYPSSFNQLLLASSDFHWMQQQMSSSAMVKTSRKRKQPLDENFVSNKRKMIDHFQNDLDHLFYEWNTIHIVLESIRNAFTIKETVTEEHLDEVDRELSIAYDDLMAQVRHLERQLKRMTIEVNQKLITNATPQQPSPATPTPSYEFGGVTSTRK
jgi:hypothetical protein